MESKTKVIIVHGDFNFWKQVSGLLSHYDNIDFYPKTKAGFYRLKSLVVSALSGIESSKDQIEELLFEEVEEETLFLISHGFLNRDDCWRGGSVNGYSFFEEFIESDHDGLVILTYNESDPMEKTRQIKDLERPGYFLSLNNERVPQKLNDFFAL